MFQAEFANQQAEIANQQAEIANQQAEIANHLAEIANKQQREQVEIANKLSKVAIAQHAVIMNLLLGLFVVFFAAVVIYGIYVIRCYFIEVRHSVVFTIFIKLYHLLTHFAHFPKQQKLEE